MTPSEHFWRTGGKTRSPTTAICSHLHLLLAAFKSLLMRSSQPYLNASRSPLLPTAAADAEERRALRFNRRVKKTLSSSLPPSPFHKAAPPSLPPPSGITIKSQSPNCLVHATNTNAGEAADINTKTPSTLKGTDPGSCASEWQTKMRKKRQYKCVCVYSFPLIPIIPSKNSFSPFHSTRPHKFQTTSQMHPVTGDLRVTQSGGFLSVLRQRCGELRSVSQQVNRCTVDPHDYSGSDVIKGRISCVSCWRVVLFSTSHYKCITDCLMILAWCWRPQQGWDKKKKKDKRLKSSKTALKNKQTNKKKTLKDILEVTSEVYPTIT